ncbi:MAG: ComF family protein [Nitrospinae bacterium]|nr:ComF family protein [Nitrospinota bacterium]MBL7019196.1 ComF family protein [Nitrospinaceae bacterium]
MTIEIKGNWDKGFAHDDHIVNSVYKGLNEFGHKDFDNTYSPMGRLVNKLKYKNDKSVIKGIVDLLGKYEGIAKFDAIIPAPSSKKNRPYQPVDEVALELGKRMGVNVLIGFLEKKEGSKQLKNIEVLKERIQELKKVTFIASDKNISGQKVLLLDDLYDTGTTLRVSTDLLYKQARVSTVSVLTMTKTKDS